MRFGAFFENFHSSCPDLTRASINFQARWIAGSSPAMTPRNMIGPPRHRLGRVNDAPTWATHSAPIRNKKRRCGSIIFINSKPRRGLRGRGESPLSGTVAPYVPTMGIVTGGLLDNGKGAGQCVF
jgi:hypothetical protein